MSIIACVPCAIRVNAAIIHVPGDQPTIQGGIEAASNWDTVLVAPGTYSENVYDSAVYAPGEQNLVIRSSHGSGVTLVEPDSGTAFYSNYAQWLIDGFTIRVASGNGTGVNIRRGQFTVMNCDIGYLAHGVLFGQDAKDTVDYVPELEGPFSKFLDNYIHHNNVGAKKGAHGCLLEYGGNNFDSNGVAIVLEDPYGPDIIENVFSDNGRCLSLVNGHGLTITTSYNVFYGNGSIMRGGHAYSIHEISHNEIYDNTAGLELTESTAGTIHHNLIRDNAGDGISGDCGSWEIYNNTISNNLRGVNPDTVGSGIARIVMNNVAFNQQEGVVPVDAFVDSNNVWGNGSHNDPGPNGISADPLFCDTANDIYSISSASPCAAENNPLGILIGALDVGCYGDLVSLFGIENELSLMNVVHHSPVFYWDYYELDGFSQTAFEIAVGTDTDWVYAEMWNPAPFETSDTFVTYGGAYLSDGETYYSRLRISDSFFWSEWHETMFRMNSLPSVPMPVSPIDDEYTDSLPILWTQNSTDAESDTLTYDFFCDVDTTYGEPDPITGYDISEGLDSTGWQVTEALHENWRYTWVVRAFDGYEYSDWTGAYEYTFFVNATSEPPTAPQAQYPPDTPELPVFEMLPTFLWSQSTDPDPLDTVYYRLEIAVDSAFNDVYTVDSLESPLLALADSLTFGTQYWWRVTAFDNTGLSTTSPDTLHFWTWTLGDLDHSHSVDIADLTWLVDYLLLGGPAPDPLFIGDVDADCSVNVADVAYLVEYLFFDGPAPKVGCERKME